MLSQRGLVLWLYGLSGAGKSTLAIALESWLHGTGRFTQVLDGDDLRTGLNADLGFSDEDRQENIRRVAEVARLHARVGIITIVSCITPLRMLRDLAREIIGTGDFLEVFVRCSIETCERRDVKGLYARARQGRLPRFTGRDSAFEDPCGDSFRIETDRETPGESLERLQQVLMPRIEVP